MSFLRYPKYKDSGVEWLGEVPEHWRVIPLKHIATLKGRLGWQGLRADEYTEDGPYLVTSEHFENDKIDWSRCYHVLPERYELAPEIQLRPDDLLMMKDGAAMGKLAFVDHLPGPACLNSHLLLFRPIGNTFTNRFLYYVLASPSFKTYMVQERTGTTFFGISQESIGAYSLGLPTLEEQNRLVAFLDYETAKIDALVAEQERLIELLKEKRQAVISHAVTKGLNPNAPMKPSGIEWLGDVPAHWELPKIGYLAEVTKLTGFEYTNHWKVDEQGDIVALRGLNIGMRELKLENTERISRELSKQLGRSKLYKGDIVLPCTGTLGAAALIEEDEKYHINQNIAKVSFHNDINPQFGVYWFTSDIFRTILEHNNMSAMQPVLLIGDIRHIAIPCPPIDEQACIVDFLDQVTETYSDLIVKAQQSIELLQERRTALISAAVTGQIDVRSFSSEAVPM